MVIRQAQQTLKEVSGTAPRRLRSDLLTDHEEQVMEHVSSGLSNREISGALRISEPTVQRHLVKVFWKLKVKNRNSAVLAWGRPNRPSPPTTTPRDRTVSQAKTGE
jgi:ATP/maltotriose-dependent transcriptional regulator MalT